LVQAQPWMAVDSNKANPNKILFFISYIV